VEGATPSNLGDPKLGVAPPGKAEELLAVLAHPGSYT